MIAVVTILLAVPLGYFVTSRVAANATYAIAYLWAFTFQTLYLLLDSLGGGSSPAFTTGELPVAYGGVALTIFIAGFGLVALGARLRRRRTARAPVPVDA